VSTIPKDGKPCFPALLWKISSVFRIKLTTNSFLSISHLLTPASCPQASKTYMVAVTRTPGVGLRVSGFLWEHILGALQTHVGHFGKPSGGWVLGITDRPTLDATVSKATLNIFKKVEGQLRVVAVIRETPLFAFNILEG
jgi:hypothetical protein